MKRVSKQRQSGEARKMQLMVATLNSISKHGYLNSTINTISAESGLSRGLISHYFENKDDLLTYAHKYYLQNIDDFHRHVIVSIKTGHFTKLFYSACVPFLRDMGYQRIVIHYMSAAWIMPDVLKMHRDLWQRYRANVERRVASIARDRQMEIDVKMTATTLIQLVDGLWLGLTMEEVYTREDCCKIIRKWMCDQFGENPDDYPLVPTFDIENFETSAPLPPSG
ncbi:MAG: transcriptional regulator, TetR family [Cypionkella sp.]|uniref:TetR/AcrR family transcriptional regulator n=1 Tax=Cypionkella sp. TaxID=2811411 RepID=UPI00260A04EC|nr:TetR/AcrR family transcriptional regulator [Cypionkella sp.]MDB5659345.1 transcriptional regulator, TetR family [Cypionkella sp.]MDB5664191.1 transcriptional regulator, TetR family [Cypionkella sp.]